MNVEVEDFSSRLRITSKGKLLMSTRGSTTSSSSRPSARVIAHRGASGLAPENTMAAFRVAVDMGVDTLEMDVRSTADGVLVVLHDESVDRTTNGSGLVCELLYHDVSQLDAGYWWTNDGGKSFPYRGMGIRIPSLEEVLVSFPKIRLNIDLAQWKPSIVERFAQLIQSHDAEARVVAGSFNNETTKQLRSLMPEVALIGSRSEVVTFYLLFWLRLDRFFKSKAAIFQLPEHRRGIRVVSPRFIEAMHRRNLQLDVWTINDEADMQRLLSWGVDGIITDYPDKLLSVTGSRSRELHISSELVTRKPEES